MAKVPGGRSRLAINVGWLSLNQVATVLLRLCYVVAAARMLAAADYGLLAYSQSWYITVFPLALLGVSILFGRAIGADHAAGLAFASATRRTRLAVAAAVTLLVAMTAAVVEPVPANLALILIFALALAPRVMAVGSEAVLTGLECAQQTAANNLCWRTLELVCAVGALAAGAGMLTLAVFHVVSWILQAANGWLRERRVAAIAPLVQVRLDRAGARILFHDGLTLALGAFLTGLMGTGVLILFRSIHGVSDALGAVAVFLQAVGILLGLAVAMGNALLPYLARTTAKGADHHALVLRLVLSLGLVVGAVATALLLVVTGPWVALALGSGFAELPRWLPGLGLFATPILWHTLASRLFVAHARATRLLPIAVWGSATALATAPALIAASGGTGALGATLLGYLVQAMSVLWVTAGIVALCRFHVLVQFLAFLAMTLGAGAGMIGVLDPVLAVAALVLLALLTGSESLLGLWRRSRASLIQR